jgi:TRAP-type uncharacterized transport system substrate-binding protein
MLGLTRWQLLKGFAAVILIVGIISLLLSYFFPALPQKVVMATAFKGASFEYYGQQYRKEFARHHVDLELRETAGALENLALLRDPKSGVRIAFVDGGVSDGKLPPGILSLGTAYNQPIWIFYSSTKPLDRLSQLKGKRVAVGPKGSANRFLAEKILGKGGVNDQTAMFLPLAGLDAVSALKNGKVDVVWIIGSPDATAVKSLLGDPTVRLMSFPMAEAFTRIYPGLVRLVLPSGVIDIDRDIPPDDVQLIGTTAKVLVRSDLHPGIVQLLLQTMVKTHGKPEIFQRNGEFPNGADAEYPIAPTAVDFYKNGPSFMQRHLPLWLAVHVQRAIALLVAAVAIGFPLFNYLPLLYRWNTRRRLLYWYGQLKALEASFDLNRHDKALLEKQAELERIEDAVSRIRFPLSFSDQLYNLRSHIDIVRRKIVSRANIARRTAAE